MECLKLFCFVCFSVPSLKGSLQICTFFYIRTIIMYCNRCLFCYWNKVAKMTVYLFIYTSRGLEVIFHRFIFFYYFILFFGKYFWPDSVFIRTCHRAWIKSRNACRSRNRSYDVPRRSTRKLFLDAGFSFTSVSWDKFQDVRRR